MPLSVGEKLGPYEILAPIGKGGMGEVWKARDSRLGRDVAIKTSAEQFSERFEREARAVAALNHPNICTLYDVGPNYLVMEYIEGATLAERIKEGSIPLDEALCIARHVADALDAAHEKNIIHRDLKPGNIKIKPDGTVKVLDFGLAKMGGTPAAKPEDSPTLSMAATQAGMILGTAAYMSPEQARGKEVDKRADIWAFGVVLYEMFTGKKLFEGETISDVLAGVLRHEPDWEAVPGTVRRLLKRCLEKDPKKRLRDIGDAWELLDEPKAERSNQNEDLRRKWLLPSLAAALIIALGVVAFVHFHEKPPAAKPVRFTFFPPDQVALMTGGGGALALSPNGRQVLYTGVAADGVNRIYVRSLDAQESRVLVGTEGVAGIPFWSRDSRLIAFGDGKKLRKVDAAGGPSQTICDSPGLVGGGYFTADDRIVFGTAPGAIFQVPTAGGTRSPLTILDKSRQETFHAHPFPLPDGKHFLYVRNATGADGGGIYVGSVDAKPEQQDSKRLLPDQASPVYAASADGTGRLLFLREGTLLEQRFDPDSLKLFGDPVPLVPEVASTGRFGVFAVSTNGVLAYRTGASPGNELTWFDRQGKIVGSVGASALFYSPALSPDKMHLAVARRLDPAVPTVDIWLMDLSREAMTRFTFGPAMYFDPVWSPDGNRIVFTSNHGGLYWKASNGTGTEEVLLGPGQSSSVYDWSRDGRFLLYASVDAKTKSDLWALPITGDRKPVPFLQTQFNEDEAQFSPDGKWVVYRSDESGRNEIYVQPFPASAGGRWMVSNGGGTQPRWRRDGKELLYIGRSAAGLTLMATEVSLNPTFSAGIPKPLFAAPIIESNPAIPIGVYYWDTADGQRFLIDTLQAGHGSAAINVLVDWQAALEKR